MKKKILHRINFLLISVAILLLSGCYSVLLVVPPAAGIGLGALSDSRASDIAASVPACEVKKLEPGSQVIVILKDGTLVSGKYLGIDSIPNEKYAEKYAELQKQMPEESFLPSVGDTITVVSDSITHNRLKFLGFEYGHIKLGLLDSDKSGKLKLKYLENIRDKHGNKTEGEAILNLMLEDKFAPLFLPRIVLEEYIAADTWEDEEFIRKYININDIDHIQIKSKKHGTLIGCLIGSGIDAVIAGVFLIWFASLHSGM